MTKGKSTKGKTMIYKIFT